MRPFKYHVTWTRNALSWALLGLLVATSVSLAQGSGSKQGAAAKGPTSVRPSSPGLPASTELPEITTSNLTSVVEEGLAVMTENGPLRIYDVAARKEVFLTYQETVETEPRKRAPSIHVVTATFSDADGVSYDLDFLVQGIGPDALNFLPQTAEIASVAGKARYTWVHDVERDLYFKKEPRLDGVAKTLAAALVTSEEEVVEEVDFEGE